MTSPAQRPKRAHDDEARKQDLALAQSVLRGSDLSPGETYQLAERLKNNNEFGYARKLFGRIRSKKDYNGLGKSPAKVGQRHALCTYKDPDLPAADRFKRALEILDEVDLLGAATISDRQESLGLRGAVYKRRWQVEGQRADLELSLGFYLEGYELGPGTDQGYTGINAALVLDLLTREDAVAAGKTGIQRMLIIDRRKQAQGIRRNLTNLLPGLPNTDGNAWLTNEWWYYTTRAEAHFGLGEYEKALAALREYNVAMKLTHEGPPLETVYPWEFESAITQLASLAQLQADLAELLQGRPELENDWPTPPNPERARAALRAYLGNLAPGVDRAVVGKVGLALSGGGFRASLFHLGVLAYLAEHDLLRRVEVLSCVSGGSIVGAHYYLEVRHLLQQKSDITQADYLDLVKRLQKDFLKGVEANIRSRVFAGFWANLRAFLQPAYTTTRRLGEVYESELYSRVHDGEGEQPRYLTDLFINPRDEGEGFKPKYDNWRRAAKVPILVLNATTLNTGHNWQFTASWMGEPPSSLDSEIEGNYRLRRMWYREAPRLRDKWRNWPFRHIAPPDYQRFRLGEAVAASSCVPGVFEPVVLPDLFEGKTVRLVDGGVYDNQGIASLLEQDCNFIIVSDASGQMEAQDHASGGRLGVSLRSFSVSMARVRQEQYRELDARKRSGLLKGLVFLHLKKDLDADPVNWRECRDPVEASDEARPAELRGVLTRYGLDKSIQARLSAIRTDLDSFTEVEAFSLMTSGYRMAQHEFELLKNLPEAKQPPEGWRFLDIEPVLSPGRGYDDLLRQLQVAAKSAGNVWRLWLPLKVLGCALIPLALFGLFWLWRVYGAKVLLTVGGLGLFLAALAATMGAPHLVRLIRYRQTFQEIGLRSLLAAVLALAFKLHLLIFDPLFLRLGRLERLLSMRRDREPHLRQP